ncbi:hypothetical protein D3C78_1467750 [compost metagenome]
MRFTLPGIVEKVLKLNIVATEEVKDKIQITKQKEVDALRIVTDASGETYVLRLEFESGYTEKMNFRMAEYRSMLHQIYDHPVKQYWLIWEMRIRPKCSGQFWKKSVKTTRED